MHKRIHFYASEDDQAIMSNIKEQKPHWSMNLMIREGLRLLMKSLEGEAQKQSQAGIRYIREG